MTHSHIIKTKKPKTSKKKNHFLYYLSHTFSQSSIDIWTSHVQGKLNRAWDTPCVYVTVLSCVTLVLFWVQGWEPFGGGDLRFKTRQSTSKDLKIEAVEAAAQRQTGWRLLLIMILWGRAGKQTVPLKREWELHVHVLHLLQLGIIQQVSSNRSPRSFHFNTGYCRWPPRRPPRCPPPDGALVWEHKKEHCEERGKEIWKPLKSFICFSLIFTCANCAGL